MEALIVAIVFGTPVAIVGLVKHYKMRQRELELRAKLGPGADPNAAADHKRIEELTVEKKRLEARVENLETIVCSVEFELNQRLSRLAIGASSLASAEASRLQLPASPAPPLQLPPGGQPAALSPASMAPRSVEGATARSALATGETQAAYVLGRLEIGQQVLERYTVKRELGRGGMGAVYLADDASLGEAVALKVLSSILATDPAALADRFRREVQAARKVTHPNVIRIHDLGEAGPLLFLSMEYFAGETLWERIRRMGPLPIPEARAVLGEIASGVAAAHAAGVVHRDLKPQNVLIGATPSGGRIVKVIDFGLAKSSYHEGMTATGMILGTPEYMAPEQIRGRPCDARTDVYALGALGYCLVAGRPPFTGTSPIAVGFAQVNEPPPSLRTLRPETPPDLEALLQKALNKDPADRFIDADAFRRQLGLA